MAVRLVALRFDAIDPTRVAGFWSEALRWPVAEGSDGSVALVPDDDAGVPIRFVPGADPKVGQNRNHLDLTTTSGADQRDTVARLCALGARPVDVGQRPDESHVVLADPEGNELCVLAPGNRFLAGCGRLGAVNCDGTRRTGRFWSGALAWPLYWDQDEETAIRTPHGPVISWSGPPLIPKAGRNRVALEISPAPVGDVAAEIARLEALGAARVGADQPDGAVLTVDPDDNEFRVVTGG